MNGSWNATTADHHALLLKHAAAAESIAELFRVTSQHLRRLIPYDGSGWFATDPATGLPTAPSRAESVCSHDPDVCMAYWEREFLTQDVNLFRDLARAPVPAAALRAATRDRPARSARYLEFVRPWGFGDELRVVLRAGRGAWGYVALLRKQGRPAFDTHEIELAASLSTPLAEAIRVHAQQPARPLVPGEGHEPGLMLFSSDGVLISSNDAAHGWLEEVRGDCFVDPPRLAAPGVLEAPDAASPPMVVFGTLMQARAIAEARERGIARARLRSPVTGQWVVCHASCLRNPDGRPGNLALVIEPAKAAEIAPIIVQAYELSPREQEITQLIAQGAATAEIAGRLSLSAHTIRDYIKAIFEKVGVSSRGELVARLFAEHYAPLHFEPGNLDAAACPEE
ncbi:helix-turn-helix transcriptional regulator [Nonomuraea sp. NBC_00507]|uniref:helix-turn-helix transcriptional regulator n=1 Tax=Nonomuraea sp. NBC_00507 TaxID=2976002 RepID=UPI002E19E4D4